MQCHTALGSQAITVYIDKTKLDITYLKFT